MTEKRLALCITGASGAVYAKRFIEAIDGIYDTIYITASKTGELIACDELGVDDISKLLPQRPRSRFVFFAYDDLTAPIASGSHNFDGVVVLPCSMGTLGRVASGASCDLISRCCDVCLKERKKTIFVVREAPLGIIHIKNMLSVSEAGGVVLPASPAFYTKPKTVNDMVDFVVDRIMRLLKKSLS